jgi:hypothetical protein
LQYARTYTPFFMAALLLCAVLGVIYPYYQYYVDPDATAYLTIAKRYAAGNYTKAINGYWSPWSCWLTALGIKAGMAAFPAAIIVNAIGAIGLLFISQSFFVLFRIEKRMQWLLNITLALFLSYAVFKQTFDDLWECFFLLCSLRLMLGSNYRDKPVLWILNGMIGALAYFSKAYAFPFFILNTLCCGFLLTHAMHKENRAAWLKMTATSVTVMVALSFPWIYLLHDKYGIWMTSTAGTLNSSWYLVGHPLWQDGIQVIVPPAYTDSPYYWEDPWLVNGATPHFWDSPRLFALQLVKCGYNILKMVKSMTELSAFFLLTWVLAWCIFLSKTYRSYFDDSRIRVLCLSFILFPLAFILVNFEARYIWYMLPLSMVLGALVIYRMNTGNRVKKLFVYLFVASYLVYPLWDMKTMFRLGETDYKNAAMLKTMQIKGSFTTNMVYGPGMPGIARLAYFSGNTYYNIPTLDCSKAELLAEMRRYHIRYYFHNHAVPTGDDFVFSDENGLPFPEVSGGRIGGFKVFLVNP